MLAAAIRLALAHAVAAAPPAPYGLHANRERSEALALDTGADIAFGWASSGAAQASFRLRLTGAASGSLLGEFDCAPSAALNCSRSDGVSLRALTATHPSFALPEGASVGVQVMLVDTAGATSPWSAPFYFATALAQGAWPGGAVPIWAKNASQNFVLFRRTFAARAVGAEHLLHITAHGVPNRKPGGGANATKLLCSYKLWVNGVSVAVGPGRPTGVNSTLQIPALLYDTVNVTALLRHGEDNVIAVQAWYLLRKTLV